MLNWLKRLFKRGLPKKSDKIIVWDILDGPTFNSDGTVAMDLRISVDGYVIDAQVLFDDPSYVIDIIEHFETTVKPMELDEKEFKRAN